MIEERLSRDIEVGAKARPSYNTDVIPTESGHEFRVSRWAYPKFSFEFTLEPGNLDDDEFDGSDQTLKEFVDMWHAAGGQYEKFLFRHWADYRAVDNRIATGDGATKTFQLYRIYTAGAVTRYRKITRPATGTVTVKSNGANAPIASVDYETGLVTLVSAPITGAAITASFEFDVPVRFADDEIELVALGFELDQAVNITLIEVRE